MSHCEWRPITDDQKDGYDHYVWLNGSISRACWHKGYWHEELHGMNFYKLEPQPKYYLAVTPPPEE